MESLEDNSSELLEFQVEVIDILEFCEEDVFNIFIELQVDVEEQP